MNKKIGPLKVWQIAAIGAAIGLFMLYRYYRNNGQNATNTTAGATSTGGLIDPTTGLPYAQELGLGSNGTNASGSSDTTGQMAPSGLDSLAQSLMDLQGINEELQSFGFGGIQPATGSSAQSASGQSGSDQVTSTTGNGTKPKKTTFETHKGGPFYKFYVKMTGHPPPAVLSTDNPLYQLWKAGARNATTTRPGGNRNPGHHETTHHTGGSGNKNPKSISSSSWKAGTTGKPVAPPNHQRQTTHPTGGVGLPGPNTHPHPTGGVSYTPPHGGKGKKGKKK